MKAFVISVVDFIHENLNVLILVCAVFFFSYSVFDEWQKYDEITTRQKLVYNNAVIYAQQFIDEKCPKTRVDSGTGKLKTIYICNNGSKEFTFDQIVDKFKNRAIASYM